MLSNFDHSESGDAAAAPTEQSAQRRATATVLFLAMLMTLLGAAAPAQAGYERSRYDAFPAGEGDQGWTNPVDSARYTSDFGRCVDGRAHLGADSKRMRGAAVSALGHGEVVEIADWSRRLDAVVIEHESAAGRFLAVYGNVDPDGDLAAGDSVEAGAEIGELSEHRYNGYLHLGIRPLGDDETVDDVKIKEFTKCHTHRNHWRSGQSRHGKWWGKGHSHRHGKWGYYGKAWRKGYGHGGSHGKGHGYRKPNLLGYVDPLDYLAENAPLADGPINIGNWKPANGGTTVDSDGVITMDTTDEITTPLGTSLENADLNVELAEGEPITFEYKFLDSATCGGGQPRVFIVLNSTLYNSFDGRPLGDACGTDANSDGWTEVTWPAPASGTVMNAGIVFDNISDRGSIQIRNVNIGGPIFTPGT